jgi:predicted TIM-barrel fold metal-dependent hydrolase
VSGGLADAHTHVVSDDVERYPLGPAGLPGAWYREAPHTVEQLVDRMDAAGVERAVLVQAVGAYSFDNSYAADAAARFPDRLWSACCIDVLADDALARMDHWIGARGMDGIRLFALAREGPCWLDDPATYPVWEHAAKLGAHVVVTILYPQLERLDRMLERFPGVPVSLDHCAFPPLARDPASDAPELFALARRPNLHLKVTTNVLDAVAQRGGRPASAVEALVAAFGSGRVMWGSDFCQTHDRPYDELVALAREAVEGLAAPERDDVLSRTARRLWSRV